MPTEITIQQQATQRAETLIKLRDKLNGIQVQQDAWRNVKSKANRGPYQKEDEEVLEILQTTVKKGLLRDIINEAVEKTVTQLEGVKAHIEAEIKRELNGTNGPGI